MLLPHYSNVMFFYYFLSTFFPHRKHAPQGVKSVPFIEFFGVFSHSLIVLFIHPFIWPCSGSFLCLGSLSDLTAPVCSSSVSMPYPVDFFVNISLIIAFFPRPFLYYCLNFGILKGKGCFMCVRCMLEVKCISPSALWYDGHILKHQHHH